VKSNVSPHHYAIAGTVRHAAVGNVSVGAGPKDHEGRWQGVDESRSGVRDGGLAAGQGAPVDEQALKKEVNAFMDQCWSLWSAGDIDQLATRIYHPFGQLSNTGHTTVEQMKRISRSPEALTSKGGGRRCRCRNATSASWRRMSLS
jgi:hypothetical protein